MTVVAVAVGRRHGLVHPLPSATAPAGDSRHRLDFKDDAGSRSKHSPPPGGSIQVWCGRCRAGAAERSTRGSGASVELRCHGALQVDRRADMRYRGMRRS